MKMKTGIIVINIIVYVCRKRYCPSRSEFLCISLFWTVKHEGFPGVEEQDKTKWINDFRSWQRLIF